MWDGLLLYVQTAMPHAVSITCALCHGSGTQGKCVCGAGSIVGRGEGQDGVLMYVKVAAPNAASTKQLCALGQGKSPRESVWGSVAGARLQ